MSNVAVIPMNELQQMSKAMGHNKMFGKSAEELLPLLLIAQAEGKHPALAAQEYDIINGKPALNSRAAQSRFQISGGKIEWLERTDQKAKAKFSHPQGGELIVEWTIKRADTAGLVNKDNWKKYPAQMLSARVVAEGVRAVYPACLSGFYTCEEVQDFTQDQAQTALEPRKVEATVESVCEELSHQDLPVAQKKVSHPYWTEKGLELKALFESVENGKPIFSDEEVKVYRQKWKKISSSTSEKIKEEVDEFVKEVKEKVVERASLEPSTAAFVKEFPGTVEATTIEELRDTGPAVEEEGQQGLGLF